MSVNYKYVVFEFPGDYVVRLNDFGTSSDLGNNCRISHPGVEASALEMPRGIEAANLTIKIGFDDLVYSRFSDTLRDMSVITEVKVKVGYVVDGQATDIFFGYISDCTYSDLELSLELQSVINIMTRGKLFKMSQSCRWHEFGGTDCGLVLNPGEHLLSFQINTVAPDRYSLNFSGSIPDNYLALGTLIYDINGDTISVDILGNTDTAIYLFERLPLLVLDNSFVTAKIGCNRSSSRCKQLGNFANFGGTPSSANWLVNARKLIAGTRDYSK